MNPVSDESYKFNPDIEKTETTTHVFETTNAVVKRLLESCLTFKCFNHDVIIYSNATILGGETVIGTRSTIGGNVWIIDESVPPNTKVVLKRPKLIYLGNNSKLVSKSPEEKSTIQFPEKEKVIG